MRLIIVHSHFRPGGVRRVIELAAAQVAAALGAPVREVILAGGEPPETAWREALAARLHPALLRVVSEPALGYLAEQRTAPARIRARTRRCLSPLLAGATAKNCVVWAHNQGLGRNLLVTRELARACAARSVPLVFHHHDWWFDNRWPRWPEMVRSGARSVPDVARAIFTGTANVRHAAINQSDASVLGRHLRGQAAWLPNPSGVQPAPSGARTLAARRWLARRLGSRGPYWILPCRLLRRKNVGEALLLTRWLRPEAWLVTTAGVSSAEEQAYATALRAAARRHDWPLALSVLEQAGPAAPTLPELLAASEALLLTSLLEGFGLPYLEAVAARRPLIARSLPNVAPDLARFGFRFPHAYDEVYVAPALFDWAAERRRQGRRFQEWRQQLPRASRPWVGTPRLLEEDEPPGPVPFSRLTLAAQLEVLSRPPSASWEACAPLNPDLPAWRIAARDGRLATQPWPDSAARWLGGTAYARRFRRLLHHRPAEDGDPEAGVRAQEEMIRAKLASENLYPLLWSPKP